MFLSFAPMEGITGFVFRRVHAETFPGADAYCAPFLAPDGSGKVKRAALRDLLPENNPRALPLPQILCSKAEPFLVLSRELAAMGYEEVSLNAGCPSGTVVPKHKGAGLLADPDELDALLNEIFSACPLRVSVKTRLGLSSPEEFPRLLEVFNRYPLAELVIHARDRAGMYRSTPDLDAFAAALPSSRAPVCYNGNVLSCDTWEKLHARFPDLDRVMLGRGAVANPALFRMLRGGAAPEAAELRGFLERLCAALRESGLPEHFVLGRLKEIWYYVNHMFPGADRELKALNKARSLSDYESAVQAIFSSGRFDPAAAFPGAMPA
jgi:tRNA-dihydrouridine synthase